MRRLVATLSGLALVLSGTGTQARTLPNYDALQDAKPAGRAAAGFKPVNAQGARIAHQDERTGSPTFIWVKKSGAQTMLSARFASMAPEQAALAQLSEHAGLYGLSSFEAAGARVRSVSHNRQGTKVVSLGQEASGIEVFRQSLNLLLDRNNELVAISGSLSKHVSGDLPAARLRFNQSATQAIAVAYRDLTGGALDPTLLTRVNAKQDTGNYAHYALAAYARPLEEGLLVPARVKQVLFPLPDALVPAYYVELNTGRADSQESDYYSYVVSAEDGRLLLRNTLTADADFSYRTFADTTPPYTPHDGPAGAVATPHPSGVPDGYRPPFVAPSLITLQNVPFSQNDPWLPDGATETTGNNVDAYADLVSPDNYNAGDLRPSITAPGVFDRSMLFDLQPNANAEQIAAATTNLFFVNNWLHDWFYDSGFDEASGNAQTDNYGRGGLGNDAIRAQAQDFGGINNANMSTPADGASPRMQMYIFSGPRIARMTANAPASVAGDYNVGIAAGFGPQSFDITGDVALALDDVNTSDPTATDACTALTNPADVAGKIAFVDRGGCPFTTKALNAQAAGAIGVIIADNVAGPLADLGGASADVTIPSLRLTLADGNTLRATLPGLNVRMYREATLNLDGTVDNLIVAHEWGHYLSNRLVGNSAGLTNNQGRAMGEGWSDFVALLMSTRPEDILVPSNANWAGAFGMAEYATRGISQDASYFGIRRVAYSVDMSKNALTFRHIVNGEPLPTTAPIAPGGVNAQVHNSGEVWATMLWDCYVSLLRAHPFQVAQDRMKAYLVHGFKMTPVAPTMLEARDAIIAAAYANDPADGDRFWKAFARRGAGVGAVAPARYSTDHLGAMESYSLGTNVELVSATFADDLPAGSCDRDGILDNGETGRLILTVRNNGSEDATDTSLTVFSSHAGVTLGNGGFVRFPAIPMGEQAQVSVPVTLRGATMAEIVTFDFAFRDGKQAIPGDKRDSLRIKAHYDEAPQTSATETVDANALPWLNEHDTTLLNGAFLPVQFTADLNRAFYGPNLGGPSDLRLITPPLTVSATEPLIVSFRHAFDFEFSGADYFDGAVIELTSDGGATWVDIGTPLYNSTLYSYAGNLNPLMGRSAISGTSAGFPAFTSATLDLGTAYAGQTVQVRFRIGSDNGAARTGWLLDDLAFAGITNTPFTSIVADDNLCMNRAPMANAGADLMVEERSSVALSGSVADADGDALTYSWTQTSGPAVVLSGADTLTPSFTAPDVTSDSEVVLQLIVNDGKATATDSVRVHVKNVNRVPTVNAGLDGAGNERESFTLSGSATDEDGDALTYLWTQISGTPVALSDYTRSSATFTAPETATGETLTFQLTVSDGSTSVSDTVDVVIQDVNRAPMVTASSVTVDERSTATLEASASDADGDVLTYSWTQLSGDSVVLSGADTAQATFSTAEVSASSTLTFRVTVSDGKATSTQDVVVMVNDVNRAPSVNAGLDGAVNERESFTLSGSANDEDGDNLTYLWTQVSGTPVALSGAHTAQASFTAPETAAGETLTFRLMVSDGKVTTSDTVDVVVQDVNRAPMVTASAVVVDERSTASLMASATDADGDALTYSWTQLSGTPVTLEGADTATATFSADEVSEDSQLTFRVTVSDGQATSTQDVVVTVRQVNRAPVADAGSASSVEAGVSVTLDGSASTDADGDTLTYQWTQVGGPWVALTGADSAAPSFSAPSVKTATELVFRLEVSDGSLSSSALVTVSVSPSDNLAPVAQARILLSGDQTSMTLDGSASSDPEGAALTYKWEQTGGPAVQLGAANTAVLSVDVPELEGESATFSFRLTVTDAQGASHSTTVETTAKPEVPSGGCSSTGAGAPASMLGLALLALLRRRRLS